ncbi:MAG: hypothetical protein JO061_15105, partial [Acidobacteriaceae bacterium]|nr:hypothetical protein [Acidobacteriaceae bacterium]
LAKHLFFFGEKVDAELRADAFDVLNHANFANPGVNINDPSTFGIVSQVLGGDNIANPQGYRIVQVALHLRF